MPSEETTLEEVRSAGGVHYEIARNFLNAAITVNVRNQDAKRLWSDPELALQVAEVLNGLQRILPEDPKTIVFDSRRDTGEVITALKQVDPAEQEFLQRVAQDRDKFGQEVRRTAFELIHDDNFVYEHGFDGAVCERVLTMTDASKLYALVRDTPNWQVAGAAIATLSVLNTPAAIKSLLWRAENKPDRAPQEVVSRLFELSLQTTLGAGQQSVLMRIAKDSRPFNCLDESSQTELREYVEDFES